MKRGEACPECDRRAPRFVSVYRRALACQNEILFLSLAQDRAFDLAQDEPFDLLRTVLASLLKMIGPQNQRDEY